MKVQYTFKHLDRSDSLIEYCQGRMEEISHFLLKEYPGRVTFSKRLKEFCVEITIQTKERPFRCKTHHFDVYSAVDDAIYRLERQFLKTRKMATDHKKPNFRKIRRAQRFKEVA